MGHNDDKLDGVSRDARDGHGVSRADAHGTSRAAAHDASRDDSRAAARGLTTLFWAFYGAALLYGLVDAFRRAWVCDDAFISFRYARNLARGLGLVFNAGERVEGFTNFLWTLLLVPFATFDFDLETVSVAVGLICRAGLFAIVFLYGRFLFASVRFSTPGDATSAHVSATGVTSSNAWSRLAGLLSFVPLALPAIAVHAHLNVHATSGLESSLFVLLVTWGVLLVCRDFAADESPCGRAGLGALALSALVRPDGLVFYGAFALFVFVRSFLRDAPDPTRGRLARVFRETIAANFVFLAVFLPCRLALFAYFGQLLPNTFYAKSGHAAYWDQGLRYVGLYFASYWTLGLLLVFFPARAAFLFFCSRFRIPAAREHDGFERFHDEPTHFLAAFPRFRDALTRFREAFLRDTGVWAARFAVALWLFYIARVGGDFMFARFLLPVTPLLFLLFEERLRPMVGPHPLALAFVCMTLALGTMARFDPYRGAPVPIISGISEEHKIYTPANLARLKRTALDLKSAVLAARPTVAFVGAQAALVYYWDVPLAIEAETGLTDRFIAARVLKKRGRIGHEKRATLEYLQKRRVSFLLSPAPPERRGPLTDLFIQGFPASFEIICWVPPVMNALKQDSRFRFADLTKYLDDYIAAPPQSVSRRRADLEFFRRFYFDHANDPVRLRRLELLAR